MARQRLLNDPGRRFEFVIAERVRRWAPGPAALAGQADRLLTLAERDTGMDTDFVNALTGARLALADEAVAASAAGGSGSPCKAILLLTDGRYDTGVRGNADQLAKSGDGKPSAQGNNVIGVFHCSSSSDAAWITTSGSRETSPPGPCLTERSRAAFDG